MPMNALQDTKRKMESIKVFDFLLLRKKNIYIFFLEPRRHTRTPNIVVSLSNSSEFLALCFSSWERVMRCEFSEHVVQSRVAHCHL